MLLAPVGRIGIAQAMASPAPAAAAMAGHCADMPAAAPAHHAARGKAASRHEAPAKGGKRLAVDCMIACAAMTTAPAPTVAPPPVATALPAVPFLSSLTGITPEADPPPPRRS